MQIRRFCTRNTAFIKGKGLIFIELDSQQDMSLLDSLPVDRNFIRESLDDVNIDVLDEEEIAMQVNGKLLSSICLEHEHALSLSLSHLLPPHSV